MESLAVYETYPRYDMPIIICIKVLFPKNIPAAHDINNLSHRDRFFSLLSH